MPPSDQPGVDAIFHAEIDRLARLMVDLRSDRVAWGLMPLVVVVLLDPTLLRSILVGLVGVMLFVISKWEPQRIARQGFNVRFIADNARILATGHALIILVTGGLGSPIIPVLVVFPLVITIVIGKDPSLRMYVWHQVGVILFLVGAQLMGWVALLAPRWMAVDAGLGHTFLSATLLLCMLYVAITLGQSLRLMFDQVLNRVADARSDLLAAHRTQAEELTALSGAIAHELKNPLASVKGLGALLARDVQGGKPAERLRVLREEVDRMQGILEEFLTFSRPLVPSVAEVTDVRALIDAVAALHEGLARGRGQRIVTSGQGVAQVDPRKVRQVLINLLQNALDASPSQGQVGVGVVEGEGVLVISVEDDGPGPDVVLGEHLFEAGVTTKAAGNGLGLTIARALARQQGGELVLARRDRGGARAVLTLPREKG